MRYRKDSAIIVKRKAISEEHFNVPSLERVMISHEKTPTYFAAIEKKGNCFSTSNLSLQLLSLRHNIASGFGFALIISITFLRQFK